MTHKGDIIYLPFRWAHTWVLACSQFVY